MSTARERKSGGVQKLGWRMQTATPAPAATAAAAAVAEATVEAVAVTVAFVVSGLFLILICRPGPLTTTNLRGRQFRGVENPSDSYHFPN